MGVVVELKSACKFEEFWAAYPKKFGKAMARAKWDHITNGGLDTRALDKDSGHYVELHLQATPEEIIEGAKRYAKTQMDPQTYKLKDNGMYTCSAATWLNRGRWMD